MKAHIHIAGITFTDICPLLMAWSKVSDIELADIDQNDHTVLCVSVDSKFRALFASICRTVKARGGHVILGATTLNPLDIKAGRMLPSDFASARSKTRSDVASTARNL